MKSTVANASLSPLMEVSHYVDTHFIWDVACDFLDRSFQFVNAAWITFVYIFSVLAPKQAWGLRSCNRGAQEKVEFPEIMQAPRVSSNASNVALAV